MPVEIKMPTQQKSPLERIADAVNLVQSVYGIKASSAAIDKAKLEQQKLEEEQNRLKNNILTPKEQAEYLKDYDLSPSESQGAIKFRSQSGDQLQDIYVTPKNKKATPLTQAEWVNKIAEGGKEVKQGAPGSILLSHIDAGGNTVQSWFKPKENKDDKATPDQSKAALFATRMQQAEDVFNGLNAEKVDPTSLKFQAQKSMPGLLEGFKPENVKTQQQAERNFLNAVLRRESGAAISPKEFSDGAAQYFPQAGDTPANLAQKANNRKLALAGLQAEAGPAIGKIAIPAKTNPDEFAFVKSKAPGLAGESANASVLIPKGKGSPKATTGPHGPTVVQNGHTYTWNPQTKAYE